MDAGGSYSCKLSLCNKSKDGRKGGARIGLGYGRHLKGVGRFARRQDEDGLKRVKAGFMPRKPLECESGHGSLIGGREGQNMPSPLPGGTMPAEAHQSSGPWNKSAALVKNGILSLKWAIPI